MSSPFSETRLKSLALWLLGRRRRVRVRGDSMNPLLHDGEEVFVDPGAYRDGPPRVGDIVLSAHPYRADMQLLKSVREVGPEGAVFLIGEDPATSTDSRSFGPVPAACIRGRVVSKSK